MGPGVFLFFLWHRGFHEEVDWLLLCLMHLDADLVESVSSTGISIILRKKMTKNRGPLGARRLEVENHA